MDTKDLLTNSRLLKSHSVRLDNIEGGLFFPVGAHRSQLP